MQLSALLLAIAPVAVMGWSHPGCSRSGNSCFNSALIEYKCGISEAERPPFPPCESVDAAVGYWCCPP
ncbi:hypothetical protein CcaCcLH18_01226 [Colletotrichum camelliae]|nr:hypothetical protein CcaCcLH18_01226 [Colletotrichum camelliae]